MPINAFGGGPGTGKTYGVVEHVILPAVAAGRFILTNIDGLNTDAIYRYVVEHHYRGKIFCIGHIRCCSRSRPSEPGFFPGDSSLDKPCRVAQLDNDVVVGGDLVVIDEATRYWSTKPSEEANFFFREHRHFSNEMGQTCDMVVIDPDLMLLARPLRGKIELSSITHKPKGIGLNRYVVRMFRGTRLTGKPQSVGGPYKFKPEIYALYKSYSHEGAKESAIDGRQNVLASKALWLYILFIVGLSVVGFVFAWRYFHPPVVVPSSGGVRLPPVGGSARVVGGEIVGGRSLGYGSGAVAWSQDWRLVGTYTGRSGSWVVLSDSAGRLRYESPSILAGGVVHGVGVVDGGRVSRFSGPVVQSGQAGVVASGGVK